MLNGEYHCFIEFDWYESEIFKIALIINICRGCGFSCSWSKNESLKIEQTKKSVLFLD